MPTAPYEGLLYRDLSIKEAESIISIASPLLKEIVDYSTNALMRCATSKRIGDNDDHLAPLTIYRHVIEFTDGIEVCCRECVTTPIIPLVRSIFEATLSLEYILEDPATFTQRSLSWLVTFIHSRLDMYERFDPETPKGRDFDNLLAQDVLGKDVNFPPPDRSRIQHQSLSTVLAKNHIVPIEAEYNNRRNSNWFSLFGGPSNLYELAKYLHRGAEYGILYRFWSMTSHGKVRIP